MNGKQLKNSILQWAIQGKLVPQDPNDEPASVLLERIREEKARLVKEKKIKKDKNESIIFRGDDNSHYEKFADGSVKCIDDEIPFEIPNGWAWCRIKHICTMQAGKNISANKIFPEYSNIHPYRCVGGNGLRGYTDSYNTSGHYSIVGRQGALCGCLNIENGNFYATEHAVVVDTYDILPTTFVYYFLTALNLNQYATATAQPGLAVSNIIEVMFPLPPIQEQERIVEQIELLMPLVYKYEQSRSKLDSLNNTIYIQLRKSILQEAIQGKLVPQNPNDEPAAALLERIKAEKVKLFKEGKLKKKDLVDSVIFKGEDNKYYEKVGSEVACIDDEIPFEIPVNWEWVRLGTLYQHNTGKALNGANQKGVAYEYITTSNLYWNYFVLDKLRAMPFTDEELEKCTVKKGDLLVCEGGDIGRSAIWNFDYDIRIQNHIHRLRPYVPLCSLFFYYALYLYKHIGLIGGKGIGIQGLSSNALHRLLLPLPSIAEQERIVDKIEFVIASIMRR